MHRCTSCTVPAALCGAALWLVACGASNDPARDAGGGDGGVPDAGAPEAAVGTGDAALDAAPGGTDAGWVIPAGCGTMDVALATLGLAPLAAGGAPLPATPLAASVAAVEPSRLTLIRSDDGSTWYFRTAGPTLVGAFAVADAVTLREDVDPVTQLATHVVERNGTTRAAALYFFGDLLPPPDAAATGTGLGLALSTTCTWPDARGTCGRAPADVTRRALDVSGTAGTLTLWAGDQGFRDGYVVAVVDALVLPGYDDGAGCTRPAAAYLGVTFLQSP
ncbi:MAG TPA: hypothetical protein VG389_24610 [Myxococcota bacterium]|jgi:hypothetical protein|nr:hypothetical protein [Myxococcota bacterium]